MTSAGVILYMIMIPTGVIHLITPVRVIHLMTPAGVIHLEILHSCRSHTLYDN